MEGPMEDRAGPRRESILERTARLLDLPGDGVAGLPKLELTGDRSLYLSNYREILFYGKTEVHIDGGGWMLRVQGQDLEIKAMRPAELRIEGRIGGLALL